MKRALYKIDFEDDKYGQYIKLSDGTMVYRVELPTIIMPPDASEEDINIALFKQKINYINHELIKYATIYGQYGWALYDEDVFYDKTIPLLQNAIRNKSRGQEVDYAINKTFTQQDIKNLFKDITKMAILNNIDTVKIERANHQFKIGNYYEAAHILFDIIDSQSINILLNENYNGRKQGLYGMSQVIKNRFQHLFPFSQETSIAKNEIFEKMKEYVSTDDFDNDSVAYEIINLAHAFKTLFNDCDWEKTNEQPATVNRNYLMHGMYQYNDITRCDCIKILVLLRKLFRVYSENLIL